MDVILSCQGHGVFLSKEKNVVAALAHLQTVICLADRRAGGDIGYHQEFAAIPGTKPECCINRKLKWWEDEPCEGEDCLHCRERKIKKAIQKWKNADCYVETMLDAENNQIIVIGTSMSLLDEYAADRVELTEIQIAEYLRRDYLRRHEKDKGDGIS